MPRFSWFSYFLPALDSERSGFRAIWGITDDALRESVTDITGLAQQYGRVIDARACTPGNDRGNVYIVYGDQTSPVMALRQLNGIVMHRDRRVRGSSQ